MQRSSLSGDCSAQDAKDVYAIGSSFRYLFHATKHPELDLDPNLNVIKTMQLLRSRGLVKEQFAWRHYYWYLTNEAIEYLRSYLHLPPEIVPANLKRPARSDTVRPRPTAAGPGRSGAMTKIVPLTDTPLVVLLRRAMLSSVLGRCCLSKELIEKEHQARRNYNKKWGKLLQVQPHSLYNPDELNEQLKQQLPAQALNVYNYTGHGDSYFVSGDMYETLVAKCRCGRQRNCGHVLKCLQKEKDNYEAEAVKADVEGEKKDTNGAQQMQSAGDAKKMTEHLSTTNALIGWRPAHSRYSQWEKSMKYISPVLTMPGHRIAAVSYNAIIIG